MREVKGEIRGGKRTKREGSKGKVGEGMKT